MLTLTEREKNSGTMTGRQSAQPTSAFLVLHVSTVLFSENDDVRQRTQVARLHRLTLINRRTSKSLSPLEADE